MPSFLLLEDNDLTLTENGVDALLVESDDWGAWVRVSVGLGGRETIQPSRSATARGSIGSSARGTISPGRNVAALVLTGLAEQVAFARSFGASLVAHAGLAALGRISQTLSTTARVSIGAYVFEITPALPGYVRGRIEAAGASAAPIATVRIFPAAAPTTTPPIAVVVLRPNPRGGVIGEITS